MKMSEKEGKTDIRWNRSKQEINVFSNVQWNVQWKWGYVLRDWKGYIINGLMR